MIRFEVPIVAQPGAQPAVIPAPAPAPFDTDLDTAVSLVAARHVAAAALIVRSPAGNPCDPRDAERWSSAAAAVDELDPVLRDHAVARFRATHPCRSLLRCPLAPRGRR